MLPIVDKVQLLPKTRNLGRRSQERLFKLLACLFSLTNLFCDSFPLRVNLFPCESQHTKDEQTRRPTLRIRHDQITLSLFRDTLSTPTRRTIDTTDSLGSSTRWTRRRHHSAKFENLSREGTTASRRISLRFQHVK